MKIEELKTAAHEWKLTDTPFKEKLFRLHALGVTSYTVTLEPYQTTYSDGITTWMEPVNENVTAVTHVEQKADKEAFLNILRARQQKQLTYGEFLRGSAKAGIQWYQVTIKDGHVHIAYYDKAGNVCYADSLSL